MLLKKCCGCCLKVRFASLFAYTTNLPLQVSKRSSICRLALTELNSNTHLYARKRQRLTDAENNTENAYMPHGQNSQDTPKIAQCHKQIHIIQRKHRLFHQQGMPYSQTLPLYILFNCYGPYIQDSTGIKKELVLDQDQCLGSRTNGTSGAMGRGVAELYNQS